MAAEDIDKYLAGLAEPQRTTLGALRESIAALLPDAEQCLKYSMPAFAVGGKGVIGFVAHKAHNSLVPFSGSVLSTIPAATEGFETTKGSLKFGMDQRLPVELLQAVIDTRLAEIEQTKTR